MKNIIRVGAVVATAALALSACSSSPSHSDFKACMVSDSGGFDDKSFNQSGYEGLLKAEKDFGITIAKAESADENDYAPNIDAMVAANCDLIITVGFLLANATAEAAATYPDTNFAIVDSTFSDADFNPLTFPNAKSLLFATDQAAFLAGYAAASETKTGVVGTFGGGPFAGVTDFMDGFYAGVQYYNAEMGTSVAVLGWDGESGITDTDFVDQTIGKTTGESFIEQGADIILPVAGPVGLGTAQAAQDAGNVKIIGVDSDWTLTAPEYKDVILASVLKEVGQAVYDAIDESVNGTFSNESYVGTLENGGVGLAGYDADFSDLIKGIIDGSIATH